MNAENKLKSATISTTGNNSIRFDYAENGNISLSNSSGLASLLRLGAITKTSKMVFTEPYSGYRQTATDADGRKFVAGYLKESVSQIIGGIDIIGKMMSFSCDELKKDEIHKIGWILNGLAELSEDILDDLEEVKNEIRKVDYANNRQ